MPSTGEPAIFLRASASRSSFEGRSFRGSLLRLVRRFELRASTYREFWTCLFVAVSVAAAVPAFGALPPLTLPQYRHTSWTAADGGPAVVRGMAQTREGHLWLVTESGLVRFDGANFENVRTLAGRAIGKERVLFLKAASSGGLWLAFEGRRGVARLGDGQLVEYPNPVQWATVEGMVEGPDGSPWIVADHHVWTLRAGSVASLEASWGYPKEMPTSAIAKDATGAIWIVPSTGSDLYYVSPGSKQLQHFERRLMADTLVPGPNGELWYAGQQGLGLVLNSAGKPGDVRSVSATPAGPMLLDREGGLWFASGSTIAHAARALDLLSPGAEEKLIGDKLTLVEGLSHQAIYSLFEDREGDVWLGTSTGLHRFHRPTLVAASAPTSMGSSPISAGDDAGIWAAGRNDRLMTVHALGYRELGYMGRDVRCLYRDRNGGLWAGGSQLWVSTREGQLDQVPLPDSLSIGVVHAIATDREGGLWVGTDHGVRRLVRGQWGRPPEMSGNAGANSQVTAMHTDSQGRVWVADLQGISVFDNASVKRYEYGKDGLDVATVVAFSERGTRLWLGGVAGLALFDGERFRSYRGFQDYAYSFHGINGIVETEEGDIWVHGLSSLMRVGVSEMLRAMEHPGTGAVTERFKIDESGGIDVPRPTLVQASDGRIWVSTARGVAWLDPSNIPRAARSPDVLMRSLLVDGASFNPNVAIVVVPALSKKFELFYGAVSVRLPLHLRFRYRLDGFDTTWQEVGERRSAFYENLSPGRYHFHLMVANDDGLWGNGETDFYFLVSPAWFQTEWFRVVCVTTALVLAFTAYRARTRYLTKKVATLFAARQAERERIARELHDTLLQGTQGLIFAVQSAANQLAPNDPAREALERVMDRAETAMAEGRSRIEELRSPSHGAAEFPGSLVLIGEELSRGRAIAFSIEEKGPARRLASAANDEAYGICREAILNAFQHASATRVSVVIDWERSGVRILVSDDGIGIDPEVLERTRSGHWGLAGMRERAARLKATLSIRSGVQGGATVEFTIPASVAYDRSLFLWFARHHT